MPNPERSAAHPGNSPVRFIRPLTNFLQQESGAGFLLIIAAVIALIWANSPWSDSYFELWGTHAGIDIGDWDIHLTLKEWVDDLLMVLFFFVVGLEIKRELVEGELRDPRQAALPILGAVGGMVVPALLYVGLNAGGDGANGWGIPMATDIAIVTGVIALIGKRAPSWLKLFLLALAIVDDIGAILVIAIFYSEGISFGWLSVALGAIAAAAAFRNVVPWTPFYLLLGAICWLALFQAHVHPTLTGVVFGLLAPVVPRRKTNLVDADELQRHPGYHTAFEVSQQARSTVSVVEWLEHRLHPWSAFIIIPLFALANAGIRVPASELGNMMNSPVAWGVAIGLVVGKTIGITATTLAAVAFGIGRLPTGVTPRYVLGAGALGGIGFTVSLFVTELAFGEEAVGTDARFGVLVGSLIAGIVGALICLPGPNPDEEARRQPLIESTGVPEHAH